jgi:hypothetical protein|tara:strand:- start:336 stop:515 length:180 start_codon:yes stop_codon:yes gene_type:complete
MNEYVAFYKGKDCVVFADTSYEAQQFAAAVLKPRRPYDITVVLVEKDGVPVIHLTTESA